ncbi:Ankyrin repeat-containing domain protein [Rhypophila sp. PSN 637]
MTKRKPLHISSLNGQITTSFALIDLASRAGRLEDQDRIGRTTLHIASAKGHTALVLRLLERGAAVGGQDIRGKTPLYYAVAGGQVSTTAILANKSREQDWSTLLPAVEGGNVAVVSMILDKLTKYDAPIYWADLLSYALDQQGLEDVVRVLLESGKIDANSRNSQGQTALHLAALVDWDRIVGIFLNLGADTEIRDSKRRTPLFTAVERNSLKIVDMLLEAGAKVLVTDTGGKSPLDVCLEDKAPNMEIKDLLEKHMNKNVAITATQLVEV